MITSVFSKSKPINFLIVFLITVLAFSIVKFRYFQEPLSAVVIAKQTAIFLLVYLSVLLLNFVVNKNSLTQKNNLEILLFGLFFLIMPESLIDSNVIAANFLVLLALRRLLSLRSNKNVKQKLLDAALWIALASLFSFWAILFFVLIIIALLLYTDNDIKHWVIPFVGLITIFVISVSASILLYGEYFMFLKSKPYLSLDFSMYNSISFWVAITLFFSFGLWSTFYYLNSLRKKMKMVRPSFKLVFAALVIAFVIIVISPNKNGSEFLFFFAPLAIIITNYIESISEKWFKEVFLAILVLTPIVLLML